MSSFRHLFLGLGLVGASFAGAGCSNGTGEPVGTSQARVVASNRSSLPTSLRLIAVDQETLEVTLDHTLPVPSNSTAVYEASLPAGSYALQAQVFADPGHTKLLASSAGQAELAAGSATELRVPAGGSGASGTTIAVDAAPSIQAVQVELAKVSPVPAWLGAEITVNATGTPAGALSYFWSGLGIDGAVRGSSTFKVSAVDLAAVTGPAILHVVVQDRSGATAAADIDLAAAPGTGAQVTASPSAQACLATRAECDSSCDALLDKDPTAIEVHAVCLSHCGFALASCAAK